MFRELLRHDQIQAKVVELAQIAEEVCGRLAQMQSAAELPDGGVGSYRFQSIPGNQSDSLIVRRDKTFCLRDQSQWRPWSIMAGKLSRCGNPLGSIHLDLAV